MRFSEDFSVIQGNSERLRPDHASMVASVPTTPEVTE